MSRLYRLVVLIQNLQERVVRRGMHLASLALVNQSAKFGIPIQIEHSRRKSFLDGFPQSRIERFPVREHHAHSNRTLRFADEVRQNRQNRWKTLKHHAGVLSKELDVVGGI